ncbi:histidine phosphatase family protein [Chlorobium sp. KB01]|uniref:SixA phosphatase family protein n=1 Tax=Chlorobium sp. KB01 TaxID=1917528 RepID=UPI000975BB7C|nr:histidine phosphatase family protein [Chlorobium sp. KB01]
MKTICLVRHAKSNWADAQTGDFDRSLNSRGEHTASLMAAMLKAMGVAADLVISSPANRAISTAELFCEILDYPKEKIVRRMEIYEGRADQILAIIQEMAESIETAVIFGHNPTITEFANLLSAAHMESMETCGMVRIDLEIAMWKDAAYGKGKKVWYEYPKRKTD